MSIYIRLMAIITICVALIGCAAQSEEAVILCPQEMLAAAEQVSTQFTSATSLTVATAKAALRFLESGEGTAALVPEAELRRAFVGAKGYEDGIVKGLTRVDTLCAMQLTVLSSQSQREMWQDGEALLVAEEGTLAAQIMLKVVEGLDMRIEYVTIEQAMLSAKKHPPTLLLLFEPPGVDTAADIRKVWKDAFIATLDEQTIARALAADPSLYQHALPNGGSAIALCAAFVIRDDLSEAIKQQAIRASHASPLRLNAAPILSDDAMHQTDMP